MSPPVKRRRKIRDLEREERKGSRRFVTELGPDEMWPLTAPGMPRPGPDFLEAAAALGDTTKFEPRKKNDFTFEPGAILRDLYRQALRRARFPLTVTNGAGRAKERVEFIPGHIWGQHRAEWLRSLEDPHFDCPTVDGPHPAEVMLLGKMPWRDEVSEGRNLVGPSGEVLLEILAKLHIKDVHRWYVTNLVKFMPPDETTRLRAAWIADCLPLLQAELRIVRPKYLLCIGADASKALLGPKFGVGYMDGRVIEHRYPVHTDREAKEHEYHTTLVMTVLHPAEVAREPTKYRILERGLARFGLLISGARFDLEEKGLDHRLIDTLEDAEELFAEIDAEFAGLPKKERLIGWDAEWQGQHPMNKGAYLRTMQISWGEKKAACFKVCHAGGKKAFRDRDGKPAMKRLAKRLNKFMEGKRAVGHFFVSDLEWLHYHGIYPTANCQVPLADQKGKRAWERLRDGEGWLDSAYMVHAVEETAQLGLETVAMRYTTAPRYDIELEDWKKAECKKRGVAAAALEGYGDCPDKVLVPYGNYDADVARRIVVELLRLLDSDYEGNGCWEPFWESMIVQKPILRIHQNGVLVDRARIDDLTKKFITARAAKEDEIRSWAKWPEFNIRSTQHVKEFLFGEQLNGKFDKAGHRVRIRPPEGRALFVEPLLDTSKPPRRWSDLKEKGLLQGASPTTNKTVLGILAEENANVSEQIKWVRDYRFLDQVLKSILRYPKTDENDHWVENENGELEYEAGLAAAIDDDGRVRTHIYATAETGRWKHSRPNLANISKQRDADYERLLGKENYKHKLRSVLKASPGYAFIDFDYTGAELYLTAIMAGSKAMMDHCERANKYPEDGYDVRGQQAKPQHQCPGDCKKCRRQGRHKEAHVCAGGCSLCGYPHPEYYDIHSNVAKLAFRLECHASKFGLELLNKIQFRTLAKNVIFGMLYGRQAKAIAFQAREQGVRVSVEQAQVVINMVFELYPELPCFFEECQSRALNERWLCNCFGRLRRFPSAGDFKLEGEFERQAMNFPIQSAVASAVDRGFAWLDWVIEERGLTDEIRLLLQMHDAGLVEARYDLVPYAKKLIKWAMVDMVEIWPTTLDGKPRGDGPYHLGLGWGVEHAWSEKIPVADYERLGIPTDIAI